MKPARAGKDTTGGSVGRISEEALRRKYPVDEVVRVGSNENPLGPSPRAVQAMRRAATVSHRYPPITDTILREAIAGAVGGRIEPHHIVTGNGACDVLSMIARTFLGPGDDCVICRPTFPVYELVARRNGAGICFCELEKPDFTYSVDSILSAAVKDTRLVFICSPNNPTGTLLTQRELDRLIQGLPSQTIVVFDEVYHHFVTDSERPNPLAYVAGGAERIIVVHSFSKAYGLAGCRLGYGIAAPSIIEEVQRFRLPFHINMMTVEAGLAALEDTEHVSRTVETVIRGRDYLVDSLEGIGVTVWPSQGNFVLFRPAGDAADVLDGLQRLGVIVRPMDNFYLPGYLRVTVGVETENIRFVDSLALVIEQLGA